MVGKYRTGKSYFINKVLLNKPSKTEGFEVGPTVNACTKGLWIWDQLLDASDPLGRPIKVLVIDSEGLNSTEVDSNYDNRVFMFCLLLSSLFVYNSMGPIDENALQTINLILNLALKIKLKGGSGRASEAEIRSAFPSFLWVLRDAFLSQEDSKGKKLSSAQYLESALKKQSGMSMNIKNKNRIRMQIKKFFPERDCVRMVRPVEDESKLQRLNSLEDRQLRPQFLCQVKTTRANIFGGLKAKTYQGELLTPKLIMGLAQSYLTAINEHQELSVESAWKYVIRQQAGKGKRMAEQVLNQLLCGVNSLMAGKGMCLGVGESISPKQAEVYGMMGDLGREAVGGVEWGEWKARVRDLLKQEFRRYCLKGKGDYDSIERRILEDAEPKLQMLEKSIVNTTKSKIRKRLRSEMDRLGVVACNGELKMEGLESEMGQILLGYVESELCARLVSALECREGVDLGGISVEEALERFVEFEEGKEIMAKVRFVEELMEKDSEFARVKEYLKEKQGGLVVEIMTAREMMARRSEEEMKRKFELRLADERKERTQKGDEAREEGEKYRERIRELEQMVLLKDTVISEMESEREKMRIAEREREETMERRASRSESEKYKEELAKERLLRGAAEEKAKEAEQKSRDLVIMKEMLEAQRDTLLNNKRDFRGVFEDFMLKMKLEKQESSMNGGSREVEKRLSAAVGQLTDRNTRLEEKLEKLKNFKTMVRHAASFECKLCYEQIIDGEFFEHVLTCATGRSKILGKSTRASRGHSTLSIGNQKSALNGSQPRFNPENSGLGASLAEIERGFYETGGMVPVAGDLVGLNESREGEAYARGQGFNAMGRRPRGSGRSAHKRASRKSRRFGDRSLQNFRNASMTRAGPRTEEVKGPRSIRSIRRPRLEESETAVSMLHQRKIEGYLQEKIIPSEISVEIEKTRVKLQNKNSKKPSADSTFIFYEVKVFFGDLENHVIYRKLLDFISLSKKMESSFEEDGRSLEFIEDFKATVQKMLKNRTQIESRKRILELFLCEMVQLEAGKKSPMFFRFLGLERLSKLQKQSETVLGGVVQNRRVEGGKMTNQSSRQFSLNGSYMERGGGGVNRSMQQIGLDADPRSGYGGARGRSNRKRPEAQKQQSYADYNKGGREDRQRAHVPQRERRVNQRGDDGNGYVRPSNRQKMLYQPSSRANPKRPSNPRVPKITDQNMELELSQGWKNQYHNQNQNQGRRPPSRKQQQMDERLNNFENQRDYERREMQSSKQFERRGLKSKAKKYTPGPVVSRGGNFPRESQVEKHRGSGFVYENDNVGENSRLQEDLHSNYNTVKSRSGRQNGTVNGEEQYGDQGYMNRLVHKKGQVVQQSNLLYSRFEDEANIKIPQKFQETGRKCYKE